MKRAAKFDYYYGLQAESYSFYRVPKVLFTDEYFSSVSCEAKLLYGLLLDRMSISVKNRWFDEKNRVYIIFKIEEVVKCLGCSRQKAIKLMAELDSVKGIGLIEKKRQGFGKPSIIYVKNFMLRVLPTDEFKNEEILCKPLNYTNYDHDHIGGMDQEPALVPESYYEKFQNHTSCGMNSVLLEVPESYPNNNNINYTDINYNNQSSYGSQDEFQKYRNLIRRNISYDYLCHSYRRDAIDEIVELMAEILASKKEEMMINGENIPADVVKKRFLKINSEHIEYIFECMGETKNKIHNIRKYLLSVIFNAPATINHYYQAEVNHDSDSWNI